PGSNPDSSVCFRSNKGCIAVDFPELFAPAKTVRGRKATRWSTFPPRDLNPRTMTAVMGCTLDVGSWVFGISSPSYPASAITSYASTSRLRRFTSLVLPKPSPLAGWQEAGFRALKGCAGRSSSALSASGTTAGGPASRSARGDARARSRRRDAFEAPHVRAQGRREQHRAVRLLAVLEHGDERAADGEARAVERVQQRRLAASIWTMRAVAQVGAARLEVLAVAARGDLAIRVLPRQPHLDVVGLRRGEAEVAGRERHHAVGQPEHLQHAFGVAGELLERGVALRRRGELHQLDLVELVLTDQAAHVAAVRARLGAEAGRVRGITHRQGRFVEHLLAVEVGERHLGGGHEVEVVRFDLEQVSLELGQLPGAHQRLAAHHEGRQHLAVAVLAGVEVEHQRDERPLEPRAGAEVGGEARAGELGAALEVEDAEPRSEVPVRLRREVEARRLADDALDAVGALVGAHRHALVRQVGQRQLEARKLAFDGGELPFLRFDLALEPRHRRDRLVGVVALSLELADLLARRVAVALLLLDGADRGAALLVEGEPACDEIGIAVACREGRAHAFGVVTEELAGQHGAEHSPQVRG